MLGPAVHTWFEEGAVDDQLTAAVEQVEQARLAFGAVELVLLLHGHPRHPPTLGGQRVTGVGQLLLLHEQLLARSLPLLRRHDRGCIHGGLLFAGRSSFAANEYGARANERGTRGDDERHQQFLNRYPRDVREYHDGLRAASHSSRVPT